MADINGIEEAMMRIATFNVENLFARPRVFNTEKWGGAEPILDAFREANALIGQDTYSAADRARIIELFLELDIYRRDDNGVVRRKYTANPMWAWFRKNRGSFDVERRDTGVEITAAGRDDWIGWIELATEATNEISTRMTARVIGDTEPDVLAVIEAEDRPSLLRFNHELLDDAFAHLMLVDGNDTRGIDVGIATRDGFDIGTIRSNVDAEDDKGVIFSRDCPEYAVTTPGGTEITLLINHFKSQSGGGHAKRRRQANEVRRIADRLVAAGRHVIVLGDLNEGLRKIPDSDPPHYENAPSFDELFEASGPLVDCFELEGFDFDGRPGTFDSSGERNRLDYILISESLVPSFAGGKIFRRGLWGSRKTRPDRWDTYPEMTQSAHQASDHALVYIDLNLD